MLKVKKIAVTGGPAAGKTTVCKIFKELGAYVLSADEIVHQLLSPTTSVARQVVDLLGSEITSGSEPDRKKIAAKVFSRPDLLSALEKIIHPAVFDEIEKRYDVVSREKKYPLFVAEIPLLYEAGAEGKFDLVITIVAQPEECKKRYSGDPQDFEKRFGRQISPEQKAARANHIIDNNGSLEQLRKNVKNLYTQLIEGV